MPLSVESRFGWQPSGKLTVNFSRMKVLIQNSENLLYFQALDQWSVDSGNAFDFGNSDDAIRFCAAHDIAPVQVVLQWPGTPHSIIIPIVTSQTDNAAKAARSRKQV
jgi:hypothetical protein